MMCANNRLFCLECLFSKIPINTTISNSNVKGFPSAMQMTSLNIPTQPRSRHPQKWVQPTILKLNQMFVTSLDPDIILRRVLISWRTMGHSELHLIMVQRENTCRFGRLLRLMSPVQQVRGVELMVELIKKFVKFSSYYQKKITLIWFVHICTSEILFLHCVASHVEDSFQKDHSFQVVMRS